MTTQDQIEALMLKAESGDDWAEIAQLEAEMLGGPFYCECGCEISTDETPCSVDVWGAVCGITKLQSA